MSVLPNSASLASSFVVFFVLLLLALLPSIYRLLLRRVPSIATATFRALNRIKPHTATNPLQMSETSSFDETVSEVFMDPLKVTPPTGTRKERSRLDRYLSGLKPRISLDVKLPSYASFHQFKRSFPLPYSLYYLIKFLFWEIPVTIAFSYLPSELFFPLHQCALYKRRHSELLKNTGWVWHPLAFVRDIFRGLLLPLWVVVIVVLTVWLGALFLTWIVFCLIGFCLCYPFQRLWPKGSK